MKTPMQELIEYLKTWMIDDKHVQDNPMKYELYMVQHANQMVQVKEHFIRLCKSMLEKEKEVITDAYVVGEREWLMEYEGGRDAYSKRAAYKYYYETFNTK